jgi:hypothetical protein
MGAYFNLFAPLCFYVLAARLFGKWTAVGGVLSFLFIVKPFLPGCYLGTYSPWMYANNFMQAFFYVTLLVYLISWKERKPVWAAATGGLLGVSFLGHAGTALLLGAVIAIMEAWDLVSALKRNRGSLRAAGPAAVRAGILFGSAFLVGLPLLYSILFHYRLRILNSAPNRWMPTFLTLDHIRSFWMVNHSKRNLVALFGMIVMALRPDKTVGRRVLFLWSGLCAAALLHFFIGQALTGTSVHVFSRVPVYHFFFHLNVALALFFGYGLASISRLLAGLAADMRSPPAVFRPVTHERAILCVLLLGCLVKYYPQQAKAFDYTIAPEKSGALAGWSDRIRMVEWIRTHSNRSDVFLANDMWGMYAVGPAGRKCVAVWDVGSNPYVDWRTRNSDREAMFRYLIGKSADGEAFSRLVSAYGVRFVIADPEQWNFLETRPFLRREFSGDSMEVYRILE